MAGYFPLLLPARSPNLNAFAERFVLSVKSECLDRIVPLGEAHLRAAVRAFPAKFDLGVIAVDRKGWGVAANRPMAYGMGGR